MNIGLTFDSYINFDEHTKNICRIAFYYITTIAKFRQFLSYDTAKILMHALVTFRIDLCFAHCFADDTQLYLSFKPLGNTAQGDAVQAMEKCIDAVRKWMVQDRLMINDEKAEFLLIGTRQQLDKLDLCSITVGNNRISPSPCVKKPWIVVQ